MASSIGGIVCIAIVLSSIAQTLAVDHIVGDTSGWATGVNYDSWAKGKTFTVGDNLVFNYGGGHTVDEVSKSDYDSCTAGNAITSDNTGATKIPLKTAGAHNFICGIVGHCSSGMKLSVTVAAAGGTTTPASGSSSPPATGSTPSGKTTPTSVSSAGNKSPVLALAVGLAALFGLIMS